MRLRLLPESERAGAGTEFAFVDGVAFVNAAKHEAVVAARCAERDEARAELDRLRVKCERAYRILDGLEP